jgi:hypothetical protein
MTARSKRLGAAVCLLVCSVHLGLARASQGTPEPDLPNGNETTPIAPAAAQGEHIELPSRAIADLHPLEDQVDTSGVAQTIPVGPQYRMSEHVTVGGSLVAPETSDFAGGPEDGRYVFGLRISS